MLLLSGFMLGAGCQTRGVKPRAFDVHITVDQTLAGASLQVDLVGANSLSDLPKWTSYAVTEYWQPDNPHRRDAARITYQFGAKLPNQVFLDGEDPMWKKWFDSGVSYLVVFADLPGSTTDQAGNADPRRLIIPLDRKLWKRGVPLDILIQEGGVKIRTKQKKQYG